jgi:hypothetical protein
VKCFLAAVHAPDWLALGSRLDSALASGIAGVDVRIASLDHGPTKSERALARIVLEAGLALRCHSWVGHRSGDAAAVDVASGSRDGRLAAGVALALGASSFGANAERDVWRGDGGKAHPKAVDYLDAFGDRFFGTTRAVDLDYVGFAVPSWHYRPADSDGDGDTDTEIPEHLRLHYSRIGVMAYQSSEAAIRATIDRARARWPEHTAADRIVPWLGVGRLEAGRPVGSSGAALRIAREVGEVVFYVGFGAIGQVLDGNPLHCSLVDLVRDIHDTTRRATA